MSKNFDEKFLKFIKNDKKSNFNIMMKEYEYFIPSYYFNDKKKSITHYYKIKYDLKAYLQNINNILDIIKLNQEELLNIKLDDKILNVYDFSKNIFNFRLEDTGTIFFKNDRLFIDNFLKKNLIDKGYTSEKFFVKSSMTNYISNNRTKISIDNFKENKNLFNKFKTPLYIKFLLDNYNKNNNQKKYYIELLNSNTKLFNKLFENKNILGISTFSPLFEIIDKKNSKYLNNSNNHNNSNSSNNSNNNNKFKIIGSNENNSKPTSIADKNLYSKIHENSELYKTYDINSLLESKIEKNNEYFAIFYEAMRNISQRKYDNLYDYIMQSLLIEKNFILFITSWVEKATYKKLFRLDNLIKEDTNKNIDAFMQFYDTFNTNISGISTSTTSIEDPFSTIDFENFFDKKIKKI